MLLLQHVFDILKIKDLLLLILSFQNLPYILHFIAHLNLDQPHFKWKIVTCGCGYCIHNTGLGRQQSLLMAFYELGSTIKDEPRF